MHLSKRASPTLPATFPQTLSGAEWAARLRAGDAELFEQTFRTFLPGLVLYLSRFVRTREAAEDIVQDLFLAVWRTRETLHVRESVATYLYAAARHRALDVLKHRRVEQRWAERSASAESSPRLVPPADRAVALTELADAIDGAIAALPPRGRAIFQLSRQGLTYREIAASLGLSVKTVETHMSRALTALRTRLSPFRS